MRRLVIGFICAVLLAACAGNATESRDSISPQTSTTSTTDPNNPLGCPEDGINYGCPTGPLDTTPDIPDEVLSTSCEKIRATKPDKVEYEPFDSPGIITTSLAIDSDGNKVIGGLMSDVHDFEPSTKIKSVGIAGRTFEFIAKFDTESQFQWIRCFGQSSPFHWYRGITVDVDRLGNVYACDSKLRKFTPQGKLMWEMNRSVEKIVTCKTNLAGNTLVQGETTLMVDSAGRTKWSITGTYFSSFSSTRGKKLFAASTTELSQLTTSGKKIWSIKFQRRNDIGAYGVHIGVGDEFPTEKIGLATDTEGNALVAIPLNKSNDFDPSPKTKMIRPYWIQDLVLAKYSPQGALLWANKLRIPGVKLKTTMRFVDGFDISILPTGEFIVLGGARTQSYANRNRLFLARFTPDGIQKKFEWLYQYNSFVHQLGHELEPTENGQVFVTSEFQENAPFLISPNS